MVCQSYACNSPFRLPTQSWNGADAPQMHPADVQREGCEDRRDDDDNQLQARHAQVDSPIVVLRATFPESTRSTSGATDHPRDIATSRPPSVGRHRHFSSRLNFTVECEANRMETPATVCVAVQRLMLLTRSERFD
jgi:hypothetical protein